MSPSLAQVLGGVLNLPPAAVEIIPGNGDGWLPEGTEPHRRFLLVENNLGLPQKVLYQAYLEATAIFGSCRNGLLCGSQAEVGSDGLRFTDSTLNATAVLIVLNPGHNTAWNARKRLVLSGDQDMLKELAFTTSLLTVRECAKHSLLWHHRRWLLRRLYPSSANSPSSSITPIPNFPRATDEDTLRSADLPTKALEAELSACTIACGTYERNYFGWLHRFRCLDALVSMVERAPTIAESPQVAQVIGALQEESRRTSTWIDQHISDYTAMQYQCYVNCALQEVLQIYIGNAAACFGETTCKHAESLLKAYPNHEALWLYLRGWKQMHGNQDGEEIEQLQRTAREFLGHADSLTAKGSLLDEAGLREAERHARRLLLWLKSSINTGSMS